MSLFYTRFLCYSFVLIFQISSNLSKSTPTRMRRGLFALNEALKCTKGLHDINEAAQYLDYGCYCGSSFLTYHWIAMDEIDRCCQIHDSCYGKTSCGLWYGGNYLADYEYSCDKKHKAFTCIATTDKCHTEACSCDKVFADCIQPYPVPTENCPCDQRTKQSNSYFTPVCQHKQSRNSSTALSTLSSTTFPTLSSTTATTTRSYLVNSYSTMPVENSISKAERVRRNVKNLKPKKTRAINKVSSMDLLSTKELTDLTAPEKSTPLSKKIEETNKNNGFPWYAILVIALASLVIVVIVGNFFRKFKFVKKKVHKPPLVEDATVAYATEMSEETVNTTTTTNVPKPGIFEITNAFEKNAVKPTKSTFTRKSEISKANTKTSVLKLMSLVESKSETAKVTTLPKSDL